MLMDDHLRAAHDAAIAGSLDREALLAAFDRQSVEVSRTGTTRAAMIWEERGALQRTESSLSRTWMETAAPFAATRLDAARRAPCTTCEG